MSTPLAYLLTWTCYGSRLHGDSRGTVDADHNTHGEPFIAENISREVRCLFRMKHDPLELNTAARQIVDRVIFDHCRIRRWELHARNVRTNHVHLVVSCDVHPREAMNQFKAWSTRRLREAGLLGPTQPAWTEGGSRRWLWERDSVTAAVEYVNERQTNIPD